MARRTVVARLGDAALGSGSSRQTHLSRSGCETEPIERQKAYEAIAAVYQDWGYGELGWTPEVVAETERRLAIDDADAWDSSVWFADFTLQVLDRLGVVEPYDGPGKFRPDIANPS